MDTPQEAAEWMRSERLEKGWSTSQLAEFARQFAREDGDTIKLTQQSISTFEQGKAKKLPSWFRYVRLALGNAAPPEANVVKIWDRIPAERRALASEVLKTFADFSG